MSEQTRPENVHKTVLQLLKQGNTKICAPMVRYSKLPFRTLVRRYNCDIAFTPMIVADSFLRSAKARDNEFTTNAADQPLIVQFAANNAEEMAAATELVARSCDGVDLNCGCPQRWAIEKGVGVSMLDNPDLVRDMVMQTRNRLTGMNEEFTISLKIRIHWDVKQTVELCRRAEKAGVSWITVHGRRKEQRKEPVDLPAMKTLVESVQCPVVANGDMKTMEDCLNIFQQTGAAGVMVARGLLQNPAMFSGYRVTPTCCLSDWLGIAPSLGTSFTSFHQHLIYMCEQILPRSERRVFNALNGVASTLDYMADHYSVWPTRINKTE